MPSPLTAPDTDFLAGMPDTVARALAEDIADGDITAELIDPAQMAQARIICREQIVICGRPWVDEVMRQVDADIRLDWQVAEGSVCAADSLVLTLSGRARSLLTAERTALNFLQTLSGTATAARHYARQVSHTSTEILDTRKTLPGLRLAQKYAVRTGGCANHRIGLYDAFLIKENHIAAAGSISAAISRARSLHPSRPVEVEVENLEQLTEALACSPDVIMLDNFSNETLADAVRLTAGRVKLEASGSYSEHMLADVAATGVDYISVGALTKHLRASDFSMRFIPA